MRAITRKLKRHSSTISLELVRHAGCPANQVQARYQENKKNCGTKLKLMSEVKEAVQEKLWETWSPEQIVGRLYQGKLSFKSIYRWIYNGLLEMPLAVLLQKGKCQKSRETFGHWELATVVSGRGRQSDVWSRSLNVKRVSIQLF